MSGCWIFKFIPPQLDQTTSCPRPHPTRDRYSSTLSCQPETIILSAWNESLQSFLRDFISTASSNFTTDGFFSLTRLTKHMYQCRLPRDKGAAEDRYCARNKPQTFWMLVQAFIYLSFSFCSCKACKPVAHVFHRREKEQGRSTRNSSCSCLCSRSGLVMSIDCAVYRTGGCALLRKNLIF